MRGGFGLGSGSGADVESSLREGGDLRLRVRCGVHGEYVAEAVGARPGG